MNPNVILLVYLKGAQPLQLCLVRHAAQQTFDYWRTGHFALKEKIRIEGIAADGVPYAIDPDCVAAMLIVEIPQQQSPVGQTNVPHLMGRPNGSGDFGQRR